MSEQSDVQISDEAIKWIQSEGFAFHMALVPKVQTLHLPGSLPGAINGEQVQIRGSIRTRGITKQFSTELVENDREEVQKVLDEHLKIALEDLLDEHYKEQ